MMVSSREVRAAMHACAPVIAGFIFLGTAYGIYVKELGISALATVLSSVVIFSGAAQFAAASYLAGAFAPVDLLLLSLMIGARHIFYGISMLDVYGRSRGLRKAILVHLMCDETFAACSSTMPPPGVDREGYMCCVSCINYLSWAGGTALGALAGLALPSGLRGVDFVLTSLFIVMFTEQWLTESDHRSSMLGIGASAASLALVGPRWSVLCSMAAIVGALLLARRSFDREAAS